MYHMIITVYEELSLDTWMMMMMMMMMMKMMMFALSSLLYVLTIYPYYM